MGLGGQFAEVFQAAQHADVVEVVEVIRRNRQARRQRGKSDTADAVASALAALNGEAAGVPKSRDGAVESIRALRVARADAVKARTQAGNQLRDLIVTALQVRQQLTGLPRERQVDVAARFRLRDLASPAEGVRAATVSRTMTPHLREGTMKLVRIRTARAAEFPVLRAIERAAGRMSCDAGMPEIAGYDPWPLPAMAARQDRWPTLGASRRER